MPQDPESFNPSIGETVGFLDSLNGSSSPTEALWWGQDAAASPYFTDTVTQDLVEDLDSGAYQHYTGDFNDDDVDDIFWFAPEDGCDSVWYGQNGATGTDIDGRGTFAPSAVNHVIDPDSSDDGGNNGGDYQVLTDPIALGDPITPAEQTGTDAVLVGDFDDDGFDDVFMYRAGADVDAIWYGLNDTYDGGSGTNDNDVPNTGAFDRRTNINTMGNFDEAVVGDFNADGNDDVYFDETAGGDDALWYGGARVDANGDHFTKYTVSYDPSGDRDKLVGDFNGDGYDDIYFSTDDATSVGDVVFYGQSGNTLDNDAGGTDKCAGASAGTGYCIENGLDYTRAVVGRFDSNARDDLYFHDPDTTGQMDQVWYGSATKGTVTAETEASPPTGTFSIVAGDFDGDTYDDLVFLADGLANEWHLGSRGGWNSGAGQGFNHHDLGDVLSEDLDGDGHNDRVGIVGQFGHPPNEASPLRLDILWHYASTTGRRDDGPPWWFSV